MYAVLKEMCGETGSCDGNSLFPKRRFSTGLIRAPASDKKFLSPNSGLYNVPYTTIYVPPKGYDRGDVLAYPDGLRNVEEAKLYLERKFPPYPQFQKNCPSCWSRNSPEDISNYVGKYYGNNN